MSGPYDYAPCYCEENIHRLAARRGAADADAPAYVILISNALRAVAICGQRTGRPTDGLQVWDYHVVFLECRWAADRCEPLIFDLDTRAGCPLPALAYLDSTFPRALRPARRFAPRFSVVPAADYLSRFSSDRSHMRSADGGWLSPPPAWLPIHRPELCNTLFRLVDGIDQAASRYDIDGLRAFIGRLCA